VKRKLTYYNPFDSELPEDKLTFGSMALGFWYYFDSVWVQIYFHRLQRQHTAVFEQLKGIFQHFYFRMLSYSTFVEYGEANKFAHYFK